MPTARRSARVKHEYAVKEEPREVIVKEEPREVLVKEEAHESVGLPPMSDYERRRQANIARNQAFLASLNIPKPAAAAPAVRGSQAKKRPREKVEHNPVNVRRSRRFAEGAVKEELVELPYFEPEQQERKPRVPYLLQEHPLPPGGEKAKGTASREHCVHRVRTMSDKALANRMKMIENRHGRDGVTKMRIFAEVLRDFGKEELAVAAEEAYNRMVGRAGRGIEQA